MGFRAFDNIEELEEYCDSIDPYELRKVIQDGYDEYGYKDDADDCSFSKDELEEMSQYLKNNI